MSERKLRSAESYRRALVRAVGLLLPPVRAIQRGERRDELSAEKVGRIYLIPHRALEAWQPRSPGRPVR